MIDAAAPPAPGDLAERAAQERSDAIADARDAIAMLASLALATARLAAVSDPGQRITADGLAGAADRYGFVRGVAPLDVMFVIPSLAQPSTVHEVLAAIGDRHAAVQADLAHRLLDESLVAEAREQAAGRGEAVLVDWIEGVTAIQAAKRGG